MAEEADPHRFNQVMSAAQRGSFPGCRGSSFFGFTPDDDAFLVSEPVAGGVALGALLRPAVAGGTGLVGVLDTVDELAMAGVAHFNLSLDNVLVMDRLVRVSGTHRALSGGCAVGDVAAVGSSVCRTGALRPRCSAT